MTEPEATDAAMRRTHDRLAPCESPMHGASKYPTSPAHVLARAGQEQLLGHWQGYGEQYLQAGDQLTFALDQPPYILPHALVYRFTLTMHVEIAGPQLVGDAEIHFAFQPFGLAMGRDLYFDLHITVLGERAFQVDFQNIETESHFAFGEFHLSDDGTCLHGPYHGIGLATRCPISGLMRLQKVPGPMAS